MKTASLSRHLRAAAVINPAVRRWPVAAKAAATIFTLMAGAHLLGLGALGMMSSMGAFVVLYGPASPARHRAKLLGTVAAALTASATIGALLGPYGPLWVVGLALTGALASFVIVALRVGAPGAFFIVLVQGVAGAAALNGVTAIQVMLAVGSGALVAAAIGMSDLLFEPRGPQRRAVEGAERAMDALEKADAAHLQALARLDTPREEEADAAEAPHTRPMRERDELVIARHRASAALHSAWTVVTDARDEAAWADRLWQVRDRYLAHSAGTLSEQTGLQPAPWGQSGTAEEAADQLDSLGESDTGTADATGNGGTADTASPRPRRPRARRPERARRHRADADARARTAEQIRDTSLGRPDAATLLRRAATWPSEELLIALRVGLGSLGAGLVALAIGNDHVYWAAAFTSLIMHQGGTREAQTVRLIQRVLGTAVGLAVFTLLDWWSPAGWALILVVTALQGAVEMLVVRNYAMAVALITPLALTLGEMAMGTANPDALVLDRALDTGIAAVFALAALYLVGRSTPVPMLRAYARNVVESIEEVLVDIAADRTNTHIGREHRRLLYFALLESHEVAGRAASDAPHQAHDYRAMERTLSNLGYLVLSLAWHPQTRGAHDLAAHARAPLDRILAHGVWNRRPADDIHADVRELERIVTTWRPNE